MSLKKALVLTRGAPPGEAEQRVLEALEQGLAGSTNDRVWSNVALFTPSGERLELDLLVLGHHALYALDVKAQSGRITGERAREWVHSARSRARQLALLLEQELGAARVPVESLVVLSNPEAEVALEPRDRSHVVTPAELLRAVQFGALPGAPAARDRDALDDAAVAAVQSLFEGIRHRIQPGRGRLHQELPLVQRDLVLDLREHAGAEAAGWERGRLEEAASVWIIASSFVRALEERGLVNTNLLAGQGAEEAEQAFLAAEPGRTAKDYLAQAIDSIAAHPAGDAVLGEIRDLLRRMPLSDGGARALLDFFRQRGPSGKPRWSFAGDPWTDMYQDLSDLERREHAMLATPVFVEDFLLDLTLEPALGELGAEATRVMDPACGSGLLLRRAFDRIADRLRRAWPSAGAATTALAALDRIYGADISAAAVLVARIHLVFGYIERVGVERLAKAPRLPLHIVVADSLLAGRLADDSLLAGGEEGHTDPNAEHVFERRYEVVVSEPPFVTCKDAARREVYRKLYRSAAGNFSLAVPFIERCFQLAAEGGFVGVFATNSFMMRNFGRPLIEEVLPKVELTHVIDTSGAYIPGHGTPTLLLVGRNRPPISATVRIVVGKRGEPITPLDPAKGEVWSSIARHHEDTGYEDTYISVAEIPRSSLAKHPWSLGSRAHAELREILEQRSARRLRDLAEGVGAGGYSGQEEVFVMPPDVPERLGIEPGIARPYASGWAVRDWTIVPESAALVPYDQASGRPLPPDSGARWWRFLWRYRTTLRARAALGKPLAGPWWAWSMWRPAPSPALPRLLHAAVSRTNAFVLERGGATLGRTVYSIELREGASMDDRLALLGYLNSSTACFWMKQVSFQKLAPTPDPSAGGLYDFGSRLGDIPIPQAILEPGPLRALSILLAKQLDEAAAELSACSPERVLGAWDRGSRDSLVEAMGDAQMREIAILRRMVTAQEDLDWLIYEAIGLTGGTIGRAAGSALPEQRPFVWLSEEPPAGLDRRLVEPWKRRREAARESSLRPVLESPLCKRPYHRLSAPDAIAAEETDDEDALEALRAAPNEIGRGRDFRRRMAVACEGWLLDRLEDVLRSLEAPRCLSTGELSARLAAAAGALDVISIYRRRVGQGELTALAAALVDAHAVAHLAGDRHTKTGLEKRAAWEETWQMQEREDAGEDVVVPVPPKYDAKDYRDAVTWRLRGKLDVPRERFIRYPAAAPDGVEPMYGWAGWNAEQRAMVLKALHEKGKRGHDR
jgi:hypothetical protein